MLLCNIRMKFNAMNNYLELLGMNLSSLKQQHVDDSDAPNRSNAAKPDAAVFQRRNIVSPIGDEVSYLHKEIMPQAQKSFRLNGRSDVGPVIQLIRPLDSNGWLEPEFNTEFNEEPAKRSMHPSSEFPDPEYQSIVHKSGTQTLHIADKFDTKLTKLCYWHDEICEIGKIVNVLFSFQMLVLMAYAFLSITAQFYFVYCGLVQQTVPLLFKSAENISISVVYFASTAFCCVYIIYMCWQTRNASNQMGVFLHKVANIVDENHFYETVSWKSLNKFNTSNQIKFMEMRILHISFR